MNELQDRIVQEARSYIGVKWKHLGRNRLGIDCAGLVIEVGKAVGYLDPDFSVGNYARVPKRYDFMNYFKDNAHQVQTAKMEHGDILVVKFDSRYPCHCGFLSINPDGSRTFIHSSARDKQVLEQSYEDFRLSHIGTFRFVLE